MNMTLTDDIQASIKQNRAVIGYNESVNYIKANEPKTIVIANNMPAGMKEKIGHNAKVGDMKLEVFDGTSKELGIICGRPFPISMLIIKG